MPDSPVRVSPFHASDALVAGLRLAADRLAADAVQLYAADAAGRLALAGQGGTLAPDLAALAETLGAAPAVFDVTEAVDGFRFAAGLRVGPTALLVLNVATRTPDASWLAALADAGTLAAGLAAPPAATAGHARLLHEIATHPGTFDEQLGLALAGLADALALDAAAFARIDDGTWTPVAASDPSGLFPAGPAALASLPCALTVRADGPVAIENAGADFGTYLATPVFAGGRTVGTLAAASRRPRPAPVSPDDRALVESLARWIGGAVAGQAAAQQLADREAALSAFVDRAPIAMGLVVPVGADDFQFVSANAATARLFGRRPDAVAGCLASEVGLDEAARRAAVAGCEDVLGRPPAAAVAVDRARTPLVLDIDTPVGRRTVEATLGRLDVHADGGRPVACVSFVAEDVTERETGLRTAADAQASLFSALNHDLRSGLATVVGYADLLGPDAEPDDVEQVRAVLLRAGQRMLASLDDVADAALAGTSRAPRALVPTDVAALVRAAVDAQRLAAAAPQAEVTFEAAVGAAPLLLDPILTERVVRRLVAGALSVAGPRGVDTRLSEDGSWLVFDVGVHGAGPAVAGSTRWLDVVHRLVEAMGGQADAHAETAGRWTVRLPRRPAVFVDLPEAVPVERA